MTLALVIRVATVNVSKFLKLIELLMNFELIILLIRSMHCFVCLCDGLFYERGSDKMAYS